MKNSIKPNPDEKGLHIPAELADKTGLSSATELDLYGSSAFVLLADKSLTPIQMVEGVEMLNTVIQSLINRLEAAARDVEQECIQITNKRDHVQILIPHGLLAEAGFSTHPDLDIQISQGEIYIAEEDMDDMDDEDIPMDHVPEYLINILADRGLDVGVLGCLFECEEKFHE